MISVNLPGNAPVDWLDWDTPLQQFAAATGLVTSAFDTGFVRRIGPKTGSRLADLLAAGRQPAEALATLERLGGDLVAEGEAALTSVSSGYAAGELDLIATVLLQAEILAGQTAAVELTGQVSAARIDLLLATEDDALLPGGGR